MADRDELLLDAALRSYGDPGPNSGLEQRILHRIAEHAGDKAQHPWRVRPFWAAGFSLAAVSLLLVFVFAPRPKTVPRPSNAQASIERRTSQPDTVEAPQQSRTLQIHRKKLTPRSIPRSTSAPKLAVFPTPTPLTPQERALVLLVITASAEQRKDLIAAQQPVDAPLHIAAISIPSLKPPETGKE